MPFPHIPGSEGAGTVTAVGEDVTDLAVGDTVAWADCPDSYAEFVRVTAARALKVPVGVNLDVAAAIPLQGLTAHYLATSTYPVQAGDTILVHGYSLLWSVGRVKDCRGEPSADQTAST